MRRAAFEVIAILTAAVIGMAAGRYRRNHEPMVMVTRCDTVTFHDTMRIDHFREVTKMVRDTVLIAITDTVVQNDTVFARLPREEVTIKDSLFTAQISGYRPSLDWIDINTQVRVITLETARYEAQKRWSLGVTVGPSAVLTPKGNLYGGLGATIGVQYRF